MTKICPIPYLGRALNSDHTLAYINIGKTVIETSPDTVKIEKHFTPVVQPALSLIPTLTLIRI